ncbi:MAG: prephenate dehydratase [Planctomycetota bacterium]
MGKKKGKRSTAARMTPAQWKKQIERLDRELVKLLNQQAEAAQQLAKASGGQAASAFPAVGADEARLQQAEASNRGPLRNTTVRAVFRELLSGTRCLLHELRVCYLGPEFSYSHLAAVQRFGTSAELVPVATISSVFDSLNRGQADFGLVPIENSTDGRVTDTLDMFARLPVKIGGEVQLRIHHHLLGKCRRAEVREVYSKPQALSQCRAFLAQHLPQARPVEMASTAAAARLAAEKPGAAAIASRQAGVNYGLDFIAENIEDNRNNITRFAVIGGEPPKRSGNDKTSLMFELPHEPGALADATAVFKRNQLNLTWIESFPMPQTPNEYLFFIEFQGHPNETRTQQALKALEKKTVRLEVLGCYPAAPALD